MKRGLILNRRMLKYQQIYRHATGGDTLLIHQRHAMKRLLLLIVLAGCSPSISELQAQRDELRATASRLAYEAELMERWLGDMDSDEMRQVRPEVDRIRGDELIDVCRDNKKAQLAKVVRQLGSVEARLGKAILD
jgi:hypothetical protein